MMPTKIGAREARFQVLDRLLTVREFLERLGDG